MLAVLRGLRLLLNILAWDELPTVLKMLIIISLWIVAGYLAAILIVVGLY